MIKLKETLRLKHEAKLSIRQIARSLNLSGGAVAKYLKRFEHSALPWPLPEGVDEPQLAAALRAERTSSTSNNMAEPDFGVIEQELKRKGMTRQLLWEEYAAVHPDNHYSYSHFTVRFRRWRQSRQLSMRQHHRAGEKLLGHKSLETTAIYMDLVGEEERAEVVGVW